MPRKKLADHLYGWDVLCDDGKKLFLLGMFAKKKDDLEILTPKNGGFKKEKPIEVVLMTFDHYLSMCISDPRRYTIAGRLVKGSKDPLNRAINKAVMRVVNRKAALTAKKEES